MAEGRMAYGWPALFILIFVISLMYILLDPFVGSVYEAGLQLNAELQPILDYLNLLWTWLPLAFAFALIIWAVNMAIGNSPRPDRILFGWFLVVILIVVIMTGYLGMDPVISSIIGWAEQINDTFATSLNTLSIAWRNYPYPVTIGVLVWAYIQSVSSEQNTYYYEQ